MPFSRLDEGIDKRSMYAAYAEEPGIGRCVGLGRLACGGSGKAVVNWGSLISRLNSTIRDSINASRKTCVEDEQALDQATQEK